MVIYLPQRKEYTLGYRNNHALCGQSGKHMWVPGDQPQTHPTCWQEQEGDTRPVFEAVSELTGSKAISIQTVPNVARGMGKRSVPVCGYRNALGPSGGLSEPSWRLYVGSHTALNYHFPTMGRSRGREKMAWTHDSTRTKQLTGRGGPPP